METNNKILLPRGSYLIIATACGCSRSLVRYVLNGTRSPKTGNAKKSIMILKKAEELQKFMSPAK